LGEAQFGPGQLFSWHEAALHKHRTADVPVQALTKYRLAINLKTAKTLGLNVPTTLLARRRTGRSQTRRFRTCARGSASTSAHHSSVVGSCWCDQERLSTASRACTMAIKSLATSGRATSSSTKFGGMTGSTRLQIGPVLNGFCPPSIGR
jgi:hypothetical protein